MPRFFTAFAAVVLLGTSVYGQQGARDPKKEQVICDQLAAVAPGSVGTFQRATVAMDKHDYQQAAQLFREVVKQAPAFSPALRRLGFSLAGLGQTDDAIALGESAVKIERSPENLISLAELLAYPAENKQGTQAQKELALTLAKEANERYQGSDDPSFAILTAQIALTLNREAEARQAIEILVHKYPDLMATHYFNGIRLAMDGSWIAAENEIKKAEHMGLPPRWHKLYWTPAFIPALRRGAGSTTGATLWLHGCAVFLYCFWRARPFRN